MAGACKESTFSFLPVVSRKRSVAQDNAFNKRATTRRFFFLSFFRKTIGLNNSFTLIENNFKLLRQRGSNSR